MCWWGYASFSAMGKFVVRMGAVEFVVVVWRVKVACWSRISVWLVEFGIRVILLVPFQLVSLFRVILVAELVFMIRWVIVSVIRL